MKPIISFEEALAKPEFSIAAWVEGHSKGAFIDGDMEIITIDEPDEEFMNELKRHGISWWEE